MRLEIEIHLKSGKIEVFQRCFRIYVWFMLQLKKSQWKFGKKHFIFRFLETMFLVVSFWTTVT